MIPLSLLPGRARRRCLRLLRRVREQPYGTDCVRGEYHGALFRDAQRLHYAGLITAAASKPNWGRLLGDPRASKYPFRELTLFADEAEARKQYPNSIMPRKG